MPTISILEKERAAAIRRAAEKWLENADEGAGYAQVAGTEERAKLLTAKIAEISACPRKTQDAVRSMGRAFRLSTERSAEVSVRGI